MPETTVSGADAGAAAEPDQPPWGPAPPAMISVGQLAGHGRHPGQGAARPAKSPADTPAGPTMARFGAGELGSCA